MEEPEKKKQRVEGQHQRERSLEPASSHNDVPSEATAGTVGQMSSRCHFASTSDQSQRRPSQNEANYLSPKQIGLILRKLGDDLDASANGQAGSRTEKQG